MFDLLIRGGSIVDGSGGPAYFGDIGIVSGKIVQIGDLSHFPAASTLDASKKTITPGFIDMHSHADCAAPMWPDMENLLGQGVTTCFAGHCGFGLVPVRQYWLEMKFDQAAINRLMPELPGGPSPDPQRAVRTNIFAPVFEQIYGTALDWGDYAGYAEHLRRTGLGCNMSAQVGHHQLRQEAMGFDFNRRATEEELDCMEILLEDALEAGAWGLSIGLDYRPGNFADERELSRLMRVVARHGGIVTAHVQLQPVRFGRPCPGHEPMDGYREFLELGLNSGARVHISHLINGRSVVPGNDSQTAENAYETIALIRRYQKMGASVSWDTLPWSTVAMFHYPELANYLRPWLDICGGMDALPRLLRDTSFGALISEEIRSGNHPSHSPFSRIDPIKNPSWARKLSIAEYEGRSLQDLADESGCDAVEMLLQILALDPYALCLKNRSFDRVSYYVFEQEQDACFGTDNGCINYGVHYREAPDMPFYDSTPSAFCGMIRCLEDTHLPFEQIIHRLTAVSAKSAGYSDRGRIQEGMAADILILDKAHLKSNFNEIAPQTPPNGIDYVIVGGKIAMERGHFTHIRSGSFLTRRKDI